MTSDPTWYRTFFERDYYDVFYAPMLTPNGPLGSEPTQRQVEFIVRALALEAPARVLDLCCGHGRHSVELARRGYDVVGLDISAHHVELARAAAKDAGVRAEFIVGDMREPPPGPFDAVINMFTAFGYLESDDEDALVIERATAALRPGGRFLIDFHNILRTLRHWQSTGVERGPDGALLVDEREYDVLGGRLHSHWTSIAPDGARHESDIHPRAYTPAELRGMFERAGTRVTAAYGDFEGAPLSVDSRRVILVATKD